jgi:hypothetical protein
MKPKKKHLGEKGRMKIYSKLSLLFAKTNNCLRCGGKHKNMSVFKITGKPILGQFNCFAFCPTTGEPILIEVKYGDTNGT